MPPLLDQEEVARLIGKYDLLAVPVVDEKNHMLGIVTVDDVIDAMVHESTEDAQRFGGTAPLEEPYMDIGIVGMLTGQQNGLRPAEMNARTTAMDQVRKVWGPNFHFFERHIPRRAAIANVAGEDIAYLCDADVRGWFDDLGDAISSRLWPQPMQPPTFRPGRASRPPQIDAMMPPAAE